MTRTIFYLCLALMVNMGHIERVRGQLNGENGPQIDLQAMESKTTREITNNHFSNQFSYNPITQANYGQNSNAPIIQQHVLNQPQVGNSQSFNVGYSVKFTNGIGQKNQQIKPNYNQKPTDIITGSNKETVLSPQRQSQATSDEDYVLNPFLDLKKQKVTGIKTKHPIFNSHKHNPQVLLHQANLSPKTQKFLEYLEPSKPPLVVSQATNKTPWKSLSGNVEIIRSQEITNQNNFKGNQIEKGFVNNLNNFDHQNALGKSEGFDYSNALEAAKTIGETQNQKNTLASMLNPTFHNVQLNQKNEANYAQIHPTQFNNNQQYNNHYNLNEEAFKNANANQESLNIPNTQYNNYNFNQFKNTDELIYNAPNTFKNLNEQVLIKNLPVNTQETNSNFPNFYKQPKYDISKQYLPQKNLPIDTSLLREPILMDHTNILSLNLKENSKALPIKFDTRLIHKMGNQIIGFASPKHHSEVFGPSYKNIEVSMDDMKHLIDGANMYENGYQNNYQKQYANNYNNFGNQKSQFGDVYSTYSKEISNNFNSYRTPKNIEMEFDLKPPPIIQNVNKKRSYYNHKIY